MTTAKVTEPFPGCRDGDPIVVKFKKDDVITGDLATVALANNWAVEHDPEEDGAGEKAIADMTIDELKAFAGEKEIELGEATKKADIRAAVELALEADNS